MIEKLLALVENRMIAVIDPTQRGDNPVCQAALQHLAAGGSRVRARLCLQACLQLGVEDQDAVTLAAICELLHNASLLQDDLIDRAPARRGAPSAWAAFSDSTAICAGDLLLSNAFFLVGELSCAERLSPVLALVHRCTRNVILGQGSEQASVPKTLDEYQAVAIGKSASLLSLPLELPLLLSGHAQHLPTAQRAAESFAAAYQILDDLADYDEDFRNGALNAVSVAQASSSSDFTTACALVSDRAEQLIQESIKLASDLPGNCAVALLVYAEQMRVALQEYRQAAVPCAKQLRHAG